MDAAGEAGPGLSRGRCRPGRITAWLLNSLTLGNLTVGSLALGSPATGTVAIGSLAVGTLALGRVAVASESPLYVDIAPGPLREAIDRLAASARLQVIYDRRVLGPRTTGGLKGLMTPAQALEQLLAPTDIEYQFTANDTVALYKKARSRPTAPEPSGARLSVPAATPTITVTTARTQDGSAGGNAILTALRVDGSPLIAPLSAASVNGQILRDQQAGRIEDVLEGVSAIEAAPDGQSTLGFTIRGFPTYQYYVDGVRVSPDLHHDGFRDLANVERIDVVKGPSSTLYGRTEPGGLINIVTKQPLSTPYLSLEQQTGAFSRLRTQLDAGGPLSSSGSLLYRFNAAYETADSFRQDLRNHRLFLAPVVRWNVPDGSEVTAYLEYLNSDDPTDSGLPILGSALPPVPIGRRLEEGGNVRTSDLRVGLRASQTVSDDWQVRYHLDGRWLKTPQSAQLALADDGLDPSVCARQSCPVDQVLFAMPVSRGRTYYASAEMLGTADLWSTRHSILLGAEWFDVQGHNETVFSSAGFTTDLFNPQQGPLPASLLVNPDWASATWTAERWGGAYLQDQIAFGEKLFLLAGARYDIVREWMDLAFGVPLTDAGSDHRWDHAFKRRAGLLWHPAGSLSLYANYTENFGISTGIYGSGTGGTGTLVPAQSAHEWEVGFKAELLAGKASGSLAWFDLTQLNMSLPVFNQQQNAQGFESVIAAARSRGLELEFDGEVAPNLRLAASYAFLLTRILDDTATVPDSGGNLVTTPGNTGRQLYGAPRHGGSLWLTYRGTGALRSLKLGLGAVARTWRQGDNQNDYQLPGFAKWKGLVGYGWPVADARLSLQLNVDNLTNTRYFESLSGTHTVMPSSPRRWLASVRMEW